MKKVLKWIDINLEPLLSGILFYAIMILITIQVILRFVFSTGFDWGEELARYMFVWMMYFSFSYATRNNRHIRVSFFIDRFGKKTRKVFLILCDVLFLILMGYCVAAAIITCWQTAIFQDMSVTLGVTMNVLYAAGVVGFVLMFIRLIQNIVWKIRHFKDDFEIFENANGKYSGAEEIFFIPRSYKEDPVMKNSEMVSEGRRE